MTLHDTKIITINLITGELAETKIPAKVLDPDKVGVTTTEISKEVLEEKSIAISFSKMTDGRAYSLAAKIKEIADGIEIHAIGKINQEICYFLKRSGFDIAHFEFNSEESIFVKEREELASILNPFKNHYQSGKDNSGGLF